MCAKASRIIAPTDEYFMPFVSDCHSGVLFSGPDVGWGLSMRFCVIFVRGLLKCVKLHLIRVGLFVVLSSRSSRVIFFCCWILNETCIML